MCPAAHGPSHPLKQNQHINTINDSESKFTSFVSNSPPPPQKKKKKKKIITKNVLAINSDKHKEYSLKRAELNIESLREFFSGSDMKIYKIINKNVNVKAVFSQISYPWRMGMPCGLL